MKVKIKAALARFLRLGNAPDPDADGPVSMVLRQPIFPTLEELRSAAERAFDKCFTGGQDSQHSVVHAGLFELMKIGPHMLGFLNYTKP